MKRLFALSVAYLLCSNLLAVQVGDKATYVKSKNTSRTKNTIRNASGSLTVVEHRTSGQFGAGYVIELTYSLDVIVRGAQTGTVSVFVPEDVFAQGFYRQLQSQARNFGVFNLAYAGQKSAKDNNGKEYNDCTEVVATNINHEFAGGPAQAKIERFEPSGSIKSVSDLVIKFRSCDGVLVLGAVEIDVVGKITGGIEFYAGMDLVL